MPVPQRTKHSSSIDNLKWLITDDGSRTLWNEDLDETYHSGCGAVSETLWVYLMNSRIAEMVRNGKRSIRILEYGFGTGTSFVLAAALAETLKFDLEYYSLEKYWLPSSILGELQLKQALLDLPSDFVVALQPMMNLSEAYTNKVGEINELLTSMVERSELDADSWNQIKLVDDAGSINSHISLSIFYGDATNFDWLEQLKEPVRRSGVDAVFFDAFSPETNSELWHREIYKTAFDVLRPGGTLTSYCVKSRVQKDLGTEGFSIEKVPGPPGGKREVLRATK